MNRGKTVKLFFEEGTHPGIIHGEMMNWTGFVVVAPRTALTALYKMENIRGAGIYFLVSEEEKRHMSGKP